MEIEFDPDKDAANLRKHGVSLRVGLDLAAMRHVEEDARTDYREVRLNAYGVVADRLMVCTYTERGRIKRIISVRIASRKERRAWLS